ncbi:MAG: baseplate J/gp47 family protein, partial [Bradymonadaceae bacterium]
MADSKLLDFVPPPWRNNDLLRGVVNSLGRPFDVWLTILRTRDRYLDPEGAPAEWLDFLLRITGWPIRQTWTERRKRNLVASARRIWDQKGTIEAIRFALHAIGGISATVEQKAEVAFIVGISKAGDKIGPGDNDYRVDITTDEATIEEVTEVLNLVLPAWLVAHIDATDGTAIKGQEYGTRLEPARAFDYPELDSTSAEAYADQALAGMPSDLTYREEDSIPEALAGAFKDHFWSPFLAVLNEWPRELEEWMATIDGIERQGGEGATVQLEFQATSGQSATIPEGTTVKAGADIDAPAFETDEDLDVPQGGSATVQATATEPGSDANDLEPGTLTRPDSPISGLDSVT